MVLDATPTGGGSDFQVAEQISLVTPLSGRRHPEHSPAAGGECAAVPLSERLAAARAIRTRSHLYHSALMRERLPLQQLQIALASDGVHWSDELTSAFCRERGILLAQ